ncbi:MAG: efflux RND transporter periplasmic adaptor subunit [Pseudomonadales bacterium]|jgi:RND family efflux transporter MFP subunit|nr:efflux RND transporter periplasmic adaptor subunit [Pseudomonadales bacterium]
MQGRHSRDAASSGKDRPWQLALAGLLVLMAACSEAPSQDARRGGRGPVPVVVEPVSLETQRTRIEAVGTARALKSVSLFAEAAGEVVALHFSPGDRVTAGTVLVELDARDQKLALELADVRLADAQQLMDRYTAANRRGERTVPETTVDATRTALQTARIERDRARVALERRYVTAPFDGYVGITDIDAGDRVDPATQITTLDDRTALLVSFDVPEAFIARVTRGDPIEIEAWSAERTRATGTVVDIGSRIDPASRAFVARAEVPNPDDVLRPGMSFRVNLDLRGAQYPAVPEVAVQWGADGAFVWVAEEGAVRRVPANIVQRLGGRVLVNAALEAGEMVVGEGVQSMRDGIAVRAMDPSALARDARGVLMAPAADG